MKIVADRFSFDFSDAIDAFVFDERSKDKPTYHGQPMKAVDIIAEFKEAYVFVEMKDIYEPELYDIGSAKDDKEKKNRGEHLNRLKESLKYKYRDSYLYRHAERKVNKPIHYVCLITLEDALTVVLQKNLATELPVGKASARWRQEIVNSCQVVNIDAWNKNFPKWPVTYTP